MSKIRVLQLKVSCSDTHCCECAYLSDERDEDIEECECLLIAQALPADDYGDALRHEDCIAMERGE